MINQDFIKSQIIGMGTEKFDQLVAFILNKVFGCVCNVNGKGDGGCDFRSFGTKNRYVLFQDANGHPVFSVQATIQETDWQDKAFADAKKSKDNIPNLTGYIFITSRPREQADLLPLQYKISSELGLSATCIGARELSGIIFEKKLFAEFMAVTGLAIGEEIIGQPDAKLKMLYRLFALNQGRSHVRSEIFDTILLSRLSMNAEGLARNKLIEETIKFLGISELKNPEINSRIDSLLHGKIQKIGDKLFLKEETKKELQIANAIYTDELNFFKSGISDIIKSNGGVINIKSAESLALSIAEFYVASQAQKLNRLALSSLLQLPNGQIHTFADFTKDLSAQKIPKASITKVQNEILAFASVNALLKKLVNAVIYASLDHSSNPCSVLMLGQYEWQNIKLITDTTIAIPYLATSMFATTGGRFSDASNTIIKMLKKNNAHFVITGNYINECASHLVEAYAYCDVVNEFSLELQDSKNGFISHYCQMKAKGIADMPNTLPEYIRSISGEAVKNYSDKRYKIKRVMEEIQPLFAELGISFEQILPYDEEKYRKDLETEYSFSLESSGKKRPKHLIRHDLNTLAHIRRDYSEKSQAFILLTWDSLLIKLSKFMAQSGMIITPAEAIDLFQSSEEISEGKLHAIAFEYAMVNDQPRLLAAEFLDHLTAIASQQSPEWKQRNLTRNLLSEFLAKADRASQASSIAGNSSMIDEFLKEKGLLPNNNDNDDQEDE